MDYTALDGSPMINVLVYLHNGGSPVTSSIYLQTPVGGSPKQLVEIYTPGDGSPIDNVLVHTLLGGTLATFSKVLHT